MTKDIDDNDELVFSITKNGMKVLNRAIHTYGIESQLDMTVEEMSELTKEICKLKRAWNDNARQPSRFVEACKSHVLEELADVMIMTVQAEIIMDKPGELQKIINSKISRLKKRMDAKDGSLT